MPTVDFTLEDIKTLIDASLIQEREHTRRTVYEIVHEEIEKSEQNILGQFESFIEYTFNPAIESLQSQISEFQNLRIIVDHHSRDIIELRARQA